ncbi:MAG: MoaF N-terminal domain-containing protein, partial [Bacteroidota bacterium]
MKKIGLLLGLVFVGFAAFSQDPNNLNREEYLLAGYSFTYQYQSGSAIDISFEGKELTYQWIAGRNAGKPAKTYTYKSRKLDSEVYLVNWHEPKLKNYITLIYNFKNNTCASSVI